MCLAMCLAITIYGDIFAAGRGYVWMRRNCFAITVAPIATSSLEIIRWMIAMSMLLEAVHKVNVPRAAALLLRGADVNTTDAQGVTPLIIACERGERDLAFS